MILPLKIRENKGSFMMILPRAIGLHLELDIELDKNKTVNLIAETVDNGVLLRYPAQDEIKRFKL